MYFVLFCFNLSILKAFLGIGELIVNYKKEENTPIHTANVLNQLRCSSKKNTAFHFSLLIP